VKKKTSLGDKEVRQAGFIEVLRFSADETACQTCLNQLDDYIDAQLAGEDYLARFGDVAVHLDACLDCASVYARLYELALAEATDQLPQVESISTPDLSFLQTEMTVSPEPTTRQASSKRPSLAELLQQALSYTDDKLILQLSAGLLPLLRAASAAPTTRVPANVERYSEVLVSLRPVQVPELDFPLTLTIYKDAQQAGTCLVEVIVEPPGQNWPNLGGNTVVLRIGDERREATTDAWGIAVFENVQIEDLPRLIIEANL